MALTTNAGSSQFTDFQPHYYPDPERFAALQRLREEVVSGSSVSITLPEHLPTRVESALCWRGTDLQESDYIFHLSPEHLQDIDRACSQFTASSLSIDDISPDTFLIASLAQTLASRRRALHAGHGLTLFRGLDPTRYSRKENICIFAGLASHMAERFGVQSGGKALIHITDLASADPVNGLNKCAASYCNVDLPVHTDHGDVVAMYTLSPASSGGSGTFASVGAVYNEMASSAPELLTSLFEDDWPMDRPPDGKGLDGDGLYYRRPIMFLKEGNPEMAFSRGAIIQSPRGMRPGGIPNVTQAQNHALDAVHFAAKKHLLRIRYQQGDLLFFNNRRLLHGRDSFRDGDGNHRHMLRLWLKDQELAGRAPHSTLQMRWAKIFDTPFRSKETENRWPLEPDRL